MNKAKILLIIAAFALSAVALSSCGQGGTKELPPNAEFDAFDEYDIESGVIVKADAGVVRIRWAEIEGAEKYILYHSQSRYGTYAKVTELDASQTDFTQDEDVYDYFKVTAVMDGEEQEVGTDSTFTPNALIVSQNDDMEAVTSAIETAHAALETGATGQFSARRQALMFLAGDYDLTAKVGYYTSVNGLGEVPTDVTLKKVYVSDKVLGNRNATCTFWRSVENVSVDSGVTWAVSQATSFRRCEVKGSMSLSYGGWASGGFLANSVIEGSVNASTQQQWMTRNTVAREFTGGSFNMVYMGCEGTIGSDVWTQSGGSITNLAETERIAEKPYLYCQGGEYKVFVPYVQENTKGITWADGFTQEPGSSLSLEEFYIADARYDTSDSLNEALEAGRHILFTPGNYLLDEPLEVENDGTVLLGIGYATLKISDENSDAALKVGDVDGVRVADILIDAGKYSKNMAVIGTENGSEHREDPTVLSNLYFRIGGVENVHTQTDTALVIHSDDVIGDNFWIWRADHSLGVAWNDEVTDSGINYGNPAETGIEVNGDRVTCYALMVEHFESYQTIWNGEDGCVVMYQSETPYRVPSQSEWTSPNGKNGCASYKVSDNVKRHRGIGIGIYLVNYGNMLLDSAIEVPEAEGIEMEHLITCSFAAGSGSKIIHVINDYGGTVGYNALGQARVPKYPL